MPLTGYNGFVGYMNKQARSWWGRRIGARLNFEIPSALSAKAKFSDAGDGKSDLDLSMDLLFITRRFNSVATLDPIVVDFDGVDYELDLNGSSAVIALKNQNIGAMIDFYPFGNTWFLGGIRLTGGYYVGRAELQMNADLATDLPNADGFIYEATPLTSIHAKIPAGQRVGGRLNWRYRGPYLGAGFDLGLFRGLKIYMDAGVVFTNSPKMRYNDLFIPERAIQACIAGGGSCDWITVDIMDPNGTRDRLLAQVVDGIRDNAEWGGVDYSSIVGDIPGSEIVISQITAWLGGGARPIWVNEIIAVDPTGQLAGIINDIENNVDFDLQGLTDDYVQARQDIVNDANDGMKDIKFLPMIRLGLMYRF